MVKVEIFVERRSSHLLVLIFGILNCYLLQYRAEEIFIWIAIKS